MNKFEALQILGLKGQVNADDIKKAYKKMVQAFHPDRNPAGADIIKMINVAYDLVKDMDTAEVFENEAMADYPKELAKALEAINNLGLHIEVCGSWVWVSGDTKTHKQALKEAGYKWSKSKSMWYYRPESKRTYKGKDKREWSIDEIRDTFGSQRPSRAQGSYLPAA